jgi:murein DD-endopeptidase MepM/ murein hydrolase activator NlpD
VQIIIVHPRLKQARTLTLSRRWLLASVASLFLVVGLSSGVLSYVTLEHAVEKLPFMQTRVRAVADASLRDQNRFMRENIDALAARLGEMQAQLAKLEALGDRVAGMTGLKPQELQNLRDGGRGGPLVGASKSLTIDELRAAVSDANQRIDTRSDLLTIVESELLAKTVVAKLLPGTKPLTEGFFGSRFGVRIDPFTGRSAMHEGIDFNAPAGTPIVAAAGGLVVAAGPHNSYGNHVDIDHGKGMTTRYAHASKLLVKEGDVVKQGQKIAEVGSTGRSTGPHLHFEVRQDDVAQDPRNYLEQGLNGLAPVNTVAKK